MKGWCRGEKKGELIDTWMCELSLASGTTCRRGRGRARSGQGGQGRRESWDRPFPLGLGLEFTTAGGNNSCISPLLSYLSSPLPQDRFLAYSDFTRRLAGHFEDTRDLQRLDLRDETSAHRRMRSAKASRPFLLNRHPLPPITTATRWLDDPLERPHPPGALTMPSSVLETMALRASIAGPPGSSSAVLRLNI